MTAVEVDVADLSLVLAEIDRTGTLPGPEVRAAAERLREAYRPSLFGGPRLADPAAPARPKHHGRETEKAAYWSSLPRHGSQRHRVLESIAAAGDFGRTDEELEIILDLRRPSAGNRRGELVEGGWVRDSGRRRPTRSGNPAVVWVLTAEGRARLDVEATATRKEHAAS